MLDFGLDFDLAKLSLHSIGGIGGISAGLLLRIEEDNIGFLII